MLNISSVCKSELETYLAVTHGKVTTNIYKATGDFLLHNKANTSPNSGSRHVIE